MLKAIIFDFDGTLAETKQNIVKAIQRGITDYGCNADDRFIERRIGSGGRMLLKNIFDENNVNYNDDLIEELIDRIELYRIEAIDQIRVFDGTIPLLKALYKKYKMALATLSRRNIMKKLLQKKELIQYFDVVITANEVTHPKPNPEIFLKCARRLEVNPSHCVVIEDSIFGVEAAKSAGMQCIAVTTGSYSKEELAEKKPDLIISSINNKMDILKFLMQNS